MNLVATIESDGSGTRYVITSRDGRRVELGESDARYGALAAIVDGLFPVDVLGRAVTR
jgi:hypothetical protein